MIYMNWNKLPSVDNSAPNVNCVVFKNVKTEYRSNEDITIEYILDSATEVSSRNWIGLYPKGARHLDQYITLEFTVMNPNNVPLTHQKITFYAKRHVNNIEVNGEYFFIFVNKHMKVIGTSSYFYIRCYHTLQIEDLKVPENITNDSSTPESSKIFLNENLKIALLEVRDEEILREFHHQTGNSKQIQFSSTQIGESNCLNNCGFKDDFALVSPDFPVTLNSSLRNNIDCCALCKRPTNFAEIEQKLNAKIKMHAEYDHTLEKRIEELEKKFEMSQVARKQLKLIAYHAKREKMLYQKFVNKMLSILTNKGAVQILDGNGTEMLLQRVDCTNTENNGSSFIYRKSQREDILKSVITSQENTTKDSMTNLENRFSSEENDNCLEIAGKFTVLNEIDTPVEEVQQTLDNGVALTEFTKLKISSENNEVKQKINNNTNETLNEYPENSFSGHILNETYPIDQLVVEPVSVILPSNEFRPKKQLGNFEKNENTFIGLNNDSQGDFHYKPSSAKENICEMKENVIKELKNAIRKRQQKIENCTNDLIDPISNDSFNISINETVQSTNVEESNALIIKGERLQYAIIR